MRKILLVLIIFSALLLGCKSLSKIKTIEIPSENLTELNYNELNGTYSNYPEKFIGGIVKTPKNYHPPISIIGLYGNDFDYSHRLPEWDEKKRKINLKFISNKKLQLTLYQKDSIVGKKVIKGKLKNGFFYSKRKTRIYPIPPLIFGYEFEKFRIGKNKNFIILDYSTNIWVGGFMVGESEKGNYSAIFKRVE